jgi:uncharacterized alkaline shock family protein YloU
MKELLLDLWEKYSDSLVKAGYLACGIAICWLLYLVGKKRQAIISSAIDGCVSLTHSTLKKIIQSVATDMGIRKKIGVKIRHSRHKMSIDVTIRAGSWQNLAEISTTLRERLRDVLSNGVGLVSVEKINVIVVGFLFGKCNCSSPVHESRWTRNDGENAACALDEGTPLEDSTESDNGK